MAASLLTLLGLAWVGHAQELPPLASPPGLILPASAPTPRGMDMPPPPQPREAIKFAVEEGKASGGIRPAAAQAPSTRGKVAEEDIDFAVTVELPGPDRLFRRESEVELFERIKQEARKRGSNVKVTFPEEQPLTREKYAGRAWGPMKEYVEPAYVLHGRLLFEQPNFERYGWDLGVMQPAVCLGVYFYDLALLPYHVCTRPLECTDSSAGKCLPGDATPLHLYREQLSVTGLLGQAAVVTGAIFVFP